MPACTSTTAKKCPATQLLQAISGKWKAIILYRFTQQAKWHFGELNATVYRLTARGETVKPVIEGMAEWIKF